MLYRPRIMDLAGNAAQAAAAEADPFGLVGALVGGDIQVERVVGSGGYGTVYRGLHTKLQCPVALKCLRVPDSLDGPARQSFVQRFLDEGRLMYQLSCADPGIVHALAVDVLQLADGQQVPYLVLEWIDGQPADELLAETFRQGRKIPLAELVTRLEPVARGLGVAHDAGIAHRDVKPSNIMFTQVLGRPTAKLLDFGLAKIVQEAGAQGSARTTRDASGQSFGFTPRYAAPEQWLASYGVTGPWTDVFSLALVCVEFICAQPALAGSNVGQWMGASIHPTARPTPRAFGEDVGAAAEAVFARALAIQPSDRYRHAAEFWRDLKAAAGVVSGPSPLPVLHDDDDGASGKETTLRIAPQVGRASHPEQTVLMPSPLGSDPGRAAPGAMGPLSPLPAGGGAHAMPGDRTVLGGPNVGRASSPDAVSGPWPAVMVVPGAGPQMGPPGAVVAPPAGQSGGWPAGGQAARPAGPSVRAAAQGLVAQLMRLPPAAQMALLALGAAVLVVAGIALLRSSDSGEAPEAAGTPFARGQPAGEDDGGQQSAGEPEQLALGGGAKLDDAALSGVGRAPAKTASPSGTLSIYCVPGCDSVAVDGKDLGPSPVVRSSLSTGKHVVAVRRIGAPDQSAEVSVEAGAATAERFWMGP